MPRIISGRARGTRLTTVQGLQTRPTGDKVKEALFSILANQLPACTFLDLYAGTGQIGLEAASRGAAHVDLVEQAAAGLACIRTNLQKTHLEAVVTIRAGSVERVLNLLAEQGRTYDLIFLDPPWQEAWTDFQKLAPLLPRLLAEGGQVILEHEAAGQPLSFVTQLTRCRSCQYGAAMLSFYEADFADHGPGWFF